MTTALTTVGKDEWSVMLEQASMLVKTGFLPKDINTPEKAVAVMLKGRELNIPPMHALATIAVIQGKPTVSPELMAALVERDYGSNALIVEETTADRCVISCCKPGWDKRRTVTFTMAEATAAGLPNTNPTWKKYPKAMLRSRAISVACKTHFQASIGGMYTHEEMGAVVNEDGSYEALPPTPETQGVGFNPIGGDAVYGSPEELAAIGATLPTLPDDGELIDIRGSVSEDIAVSAKRAELIEGFHDVTTKGALNIHKRAVFDAGFGNDELLTYAYWEAHDRICGPVEASTPEQQPALITQ